MIPSYLSLARKYTTRIVPLSKEEVELFSSKSFESKWQAFANSKGFTGKKMARNDFLTLSAEFSAYLAEKQTDVVRQVRNRTTSFFRARVRLRA